MSVKSLASLLARHLGSLPLVSFIIPNYNNEQFLPAAVASCVASYPGPRQIIVVDDGSTSPRTDAILERLEREYRDVEIIRQANKRLPGARNTGLRAARGEYIKFLDADDLLAPDTVLYQVAHLTVSDADISLCEWLRMDESGSLLERPPNFLSPEPGFTLRDFLLRWERGLSVPSHSALLRMGRYELPFFDERFFGKEDWVFWSELSAKGLQWAVLEYPGALYRQHIKSMTYYQRERMAHEFLIASDLLQKRYSDICPEMTDAHQKHYDAMYGPEARSMPTLRAQLTKLCHIARLDGPLAALLSLMQFLWRKAGLSGRWWPRWLPSAGHLALRGYNPAERLHAALAAREAAK
ncbi:glycosyltransferase family 2 protein [uncultured Desulfovibrio sp.]|uniref:glycosyltransferase family 2 protein n=1 Tax=uncultured Desulfovibrio sp. TaxID=167968 RepID=UPI00272C35FF|nr:glycosyltransferase family 2 protein [uncultured Desulfovibrio sp.]